MKNNIDITFSEYSKKDIHGTALYPATMIAPVQKEVLADVLSHTTANRVLDPFFGSGTALYEAAILSPKLYIYGCDINPLAYLIAKVKLDGVSTRIYKDIDRIKAYIQDSQNNQSPLHQFPKIDKWFRSDIQHNLSLLRNAIMTTANRRNRMYFWYHLAVVVRRYANTRSSTFKLHIKTEEMINNMSNNVVDDFLDRVSSDVKFFIHPPFKCHLKKRDVLKWLPRQKDDFFDVSITSPPYGDNATTVTYGEFSWLPLNWIDPADLTMDGWELDNAQKIDRMSVGGPKDGETRALNEDDRASLSLYLDKITARKQKKVINFFFDYFYFLQHLSRVTKQYIIMTLGNRTVDGIRIDLTELTKSYLERHGYEITGCLTRPIVKKRIPRKTSCVNGHAVSSMNDEYVLIAKKCS